MLRSTEKVMDEFLKTIGALVDDRHTLQAEVDRLESQVVKMTTAVAEAVSACDSAIDMVKRAEEKWDSTMFESMSDEETCAELQTKQGAVARMLAERRGES